MIINGPQIAKTILQDVEKRLKKLSFQPVFCDVIVGNDAVSLSYVKTKGRTAKKVGIKFKMLQLAGKSTTPQVISAIKQAQTLPNLCGLIVQLPLPRHIDQQRVLAAIEAQLDVDVINPQSSKRFYANRSVLVPPTAGAIMEILQQLNIKLKSKEILVVGQGELVGKPITHLLRSHGYRVRTADSSTKNLAAVSKKADVIISGTGRAKLITGEMIKHGAIVIDAGTSETGAGIVGDVDRKTVEKIASYLSPVPGGVGPVTVAKLLENVSIVALRKQLRQ